MDHAAESVPFSNTDAPSSSDAAALPQSERRPARQDGEESTSSRAQTVATMDGAHASVDGSVISLFSTSGRLVARYDSTQDTLVIEAPGAVLVSAPDGDLELAAAGELRLTSGQGITAESPRIRWVANRLEIHAERIVERARDSFREIENLLEQRAGRLRSVVKETFDMLSGKTTIRSRGDTAVDGERVLLG